MTKIENLVIFTGEADKVSLRQCGACGSKEPGERHYFDVEV